jgi:4'-phosphopantetheinyl transferase
MVEILPIKFARNSGDYRAVLSLLSLNREITKGYIAEFDIDTSDGVPPSCEAESKRIKSFVGGRICAKESLIALTGVEDRKKIRIDRGIFGFPVVNMQAYFNYSVSITHNSNFAAGISFRSEHPVGIDIETVCVEIGGFGDDIISNSERRLFHELGLSSDIYYTSLWCSKEALSKILKTGFMTPFRVFEISSVKRTSRFSFDAAFKDFPQYKSTSVITNRTVFSIAYPKNSIIEVDLSKLYSLLSAI